MKVRLFLACLFVLGAFSLLQAEAIDELANANEQIPALAPAGLYGIGEDGGIPVTVFPGDNVEFKTAINGGIAYDSQNNFFTAPLDGSYFIAYSLTIGPMGNATATYGISIKGAAPISQTTTAPGGGTISATVQVPLMAGDTISIQYVKVEGAGVTKVLHGYVSIFTRQIPGLESLK